MTQRLGQLKGFELPPSKKLIVRPGHTSWWGVDPSTLRVAIATIDPMSSDERPRLHRNSGMASFDQRKPVIERLPEIREYTREFAVMLAAKHPPGVVVMEKPAGFGDRPNPELAYGAGATLCGLVEAVGNIKVILVEGSKWKKLACGRGDIKKPKPSSREEYAVVTWARALGFKGHSWDEADAWGIAEFARRTYMLEQR